MQHFIYWLNTTEKIWARRFLTNNIGNVRFEVFTTVNMKNAVFWDVAPCRSCMSRRFGGTPTMEAIRFSETSVHTRTTRRHIQENGILQYRKCCIYKRVLHTCVKYVTVPYTLISFALYDCHQYETIFLSK
jgi:hypothetical protein